MSARHKKIAACTQKEYVVQATDLPLSCPSEQMTLWNAHPRVYLPIEDSGREICPYCGTVYTLEKINQHE